MKQCVACVSKKKSSKDTVDIFKFPARDSPTYLSWVKFVKQCRKDWDQPSQKDGLCPRHFKTKTFKNFKRYCLGFSPRLVLKECAVPSIQIGSNQIVPGVNKDDKDTLSKDLQGLEDNGSGKAKNTTQEAGQEKGSDKPCFVCEKPVGGFRIPRDARWMSWLHALKLLITPERGRKIPPQSLVCTRHFRTSDFLAPNPETGERVLKHNAIPSTEPDPDEYVEYEASISFSQQAPLPTSYDDEDDDEADEGTDNDGEEEEIEEEEDKETKKSTGYDNPTLSESRGTILSEPVIKIEPVDNYSGETENAEMYSTTDIHNNLAHAYATLANLQQGIAENESSKTNITSIYSAEHHPNNPVMMPQKEVNPMHEENLINQCVVCEENQPSEEKLYEHLLQHVTDYLCKFNNFRKMPLPKSEIETIEEDKNYIYKCVVCDLEMDNYNLLDAHIHEHQRRYLRNRRTAFKNKLKKTRERSLEGPIENSQKCPTKKKPSRKPKPKQDDETVFECLLCKLRFDTIVQLNLHMTEVCKFKIRKGILYCKYGQCQFRFKQAAPLRRHINSKHVQNQTTPKPQRGGPQQKLPPPLKSPYEKEQPSSQYRLKGKSSFIPPKTYKCEMCKDNFVDWNSYIYHCHNECVGQFKSWDAKLGENVGFYRAVFGEWVQQTWRQENKELEALAQNDIKMAKIEEFETNFDSPCLNKPAIEEDELQNNVEFSSQKPVKYCAICCTYVPRTDSSLHLFQHQLEAEHSCLSCEYGFVTESELEIHLENVIKVAKELSDKKEAKWNAKVRSLVGETFLNKWESGNVSNKNEDIKDQISIIQHLPNVEETRPRTNDIIVIPDKPMVKESAAAFQEKVISLASTSQSSLLKSALNTVPCGMRIATKRKAEDHVDSQGILQIKPQVKIVEDRGNLKVYQYGNNEQEILDQTGLFAVSLPQLGPAPPMRSILKPNVKVFKVQPVTNSNVSHKRTEENCLQ